MNPLKERGIAATTKTITTLFICASVLVGFTTLSLNFTQTAMAQPGGPPAETPPQDPQCPEGTTFERGVCVSDPVCPEGFEFDEIDGEQVCRSLETAPEECPEGFEFDTINGEEVCRSLETAPEECPEGFEFDTINGEEVCRSTETITPRCPGNQVFDVNEGRCETSTGPNAGQPTGATPRCPEGFRLEGNQCRSLETTEERECPEGFEFDTINGEEVCRSLETAPEECPEGFEFDEIDGEQVCRSLETADEICPEGTGQLIGGECQVRPGRGSGNV